MWTQPICPVRTSSPPIRTGMSIGARDRSASFSFSDARSGEPGAYGLIASFTGVGIRANSLKILSSQEPRRRHEGNYKHRPLSGFAEVFLQLVGGPLKVARVRVRLRQRLRVFSSDLVLEHLTARQGSHALDEAQ